MLMSIVPKPSDDSSGELRFSYFYVCFKALKDGFLGGCRPIIGVDGCHLKGPHGGILLTAVGVDPNNNMFPIAYTVYEYTFISDKQKGLIKAFQDVFPGSDHRFCVKHMHNNFKSDGYRGMAFKNALWNAACATTVNDFKVMMAEMKALDQSAFDWFHDKPAEHWSRSYFSEHSKCDMLLNNICETFNSNIFDARKKRIITMLEWIREYLMKRLQVNRDKAEAKWKSKLCPKIRTILDKHTRKVGDCMLIKSNNTHYQISCNDGRQFCVDLGSFSCTYRKWGLNGIPYKHALCAIYDQKAQPEDYVHSYYTVETYKKVYSHAIYRINGQELWGDTFYIPSLPPNFGRTGGRPATARRRGLGEPVMKKKERSLKGKHLLSSVNAVERLDTIKQIVPIGLKDPTSLKDQTKQRGEEQIFMIFVELKRANVNSQPTTCNPQSSGTGMGNPQSSGTGMGNPQSIGTGMASPFMFNQLHKSRGTNSSNVTAQSVQNGLHPRVQIRAPPPMNIQRAQFSTSMRSNTPYSSVVQPTIIGGQKFVNLSSLASTQASQTKGNTGNN
ncbi:hypothetical protein BUALT_Bualt06G0001300 [Buddleja alternifolia]|uniref:Transposase n=1 Tax=Buddleja alternifolia TaxID=168488 RepID=A0AAV6XFZ2_9LAMI|nr:hypothetical protein BUALT_Bualt06G0001300 [Buddleja alternifolia]